jgi:hypothetical protein
VFVEALLLHGLLGDKIAGREENLSTTLISIAPLLVSPIQAPTYAAAHLESMWRRVGAGSAGALRSIARGNNVIVPP